MDVDAPRVALLDGFLIHAPVERRGGGELPHTVQRLVAHLCLCGRTPRSALAGQLWPEASEDHAHGSLRSALWRLQKALPGLVRVSGVHLCLADGVRVDVHELAHWAARLRDPRSPLDDVAVPAAAMRGELLPGWYDDWVILERERLRQLRLHALELVAARLIAAGRFGDALEAAYAAVGAEPLRESAHRTVIQVHMAEGNVAEALRAYEYFRHLFDRELGVRPSGQMSRLVAGLLGVPSPRPGGRVPQR
ncbi:AfsR/SARP family transcriptional regulator [Blastococcus xanthinilyticus]|uniref:DNA-binding SARP family transcriptional activator n=1 Tax=Blastococcus xanthinilyticus TaxID=1564164 RepID=A0A5S5CZT9_9ACTN|nr:BTAD domain-containing putative transcriptional regulator [Blastococcus xanthinilyticus]TYP89035.1 DNA-binding SARP family transcriptional activator [Blastococcus xanthinilyticus]